LANYLAQQKPGGVGADHSAAKAAVASVRERVKKLMGIKGKRSPSSFATG
jgi:hypothetical protein